jgi:hypothetical protein
LRCAIVFTAATCQDDASLIKYIDAATIEFEASWRQRLAWAKLGEWRDDD